MATMKGRELSLWDVALPEGVQWIYGNQPAYGVAVGLEGRLLALSFQDGVRLYDLAADREIGFIPLAMKNCSLLFHPVTRALITANARGVLAWPLRITDAESNDRHLHIGPPEAVDPAFDESMDVDISRDGSTIVAHSTRQSAVIVVKRTNESRQVFQLRRNSLHWIAVSADGQWTAAGNWRGRGDVAVWDARIGEHVRNLTMQGNALAEFSPDSRWIVTNGGDAVRFWEVGTWRLRYTFPANVNVPSPVVFTRDSRIAAMARRGVGLHLIDLADGEPLVLLSTNQRRPHFESMCFTPDNGKLIAAQGDAGVCIWDLRTIRRQLKTVGLDWDQPPLPDEPRTGPVAPIRVEVDMGALADAR
jgi:hypothetical protein